MSSRRDALHKVGLVAIGRNEGERLKRCIRSLPDGLRAAVYVDSGSTDGSAEFAATEGLEVVALDMRTPFTAARARNAGVAQLLELHPDLDYVQMVDGDCVLAAGWLGTALARLEADDALAVVCGRRREIDRQGSIFNRLCDMEWNTPVGEARACGGDALIRVAAYREVGGYDGSVIAGEEPEMCFRLRQRGHRIERLDAEMTAHDAQMSEWSQWWKRAKRAGHAYAEGARMHGISHELYYVREVASVLAWGAALPGVAIGAAPLTLGLSLSLFGTYGLPFYRSYRDRLRRGDSVEDALLFAAFVCLGKPAEASGVLQYHGNRLRGRRSKIIEYKSASG